MATFPAIAIWPHHLIFCFLPCDFQILYLWDIVLFGCVSFESPLASRSCSKGCCCFFKLFLGYILLTKTFHSVVMVTFILQELDVSLEVWQADDFQTGADFGLLGWGKGLLLSWKLVYIISKSLDSNKLTSEPTTECPYKGLLNSFNYILQVSTSSWLVSPWMWGRKSCGVCKLHIL